MHDRYSNFQIIPPKNSNLDINNVSRLPSIPPNVHITNQQIYHQHPPDLRSEIVAGPLSKQKPSNPESNIEESPQFPSIVRSQGMLPRNSTWNEAGSLTSYNNPKIVIPLKSGKDQNSSEIKLPPITSIIHDSSQDISEKAPCLMAQNKNVTTGTAKSFDYILSETNGTNRVTNSVPLTPVTFTLQNTGQHHQVLASQMGPHTEFTPIPQPLNNNTHNSPARLDMISLNRTPKDEVSYVILNGQGNTVPKDRIGSGIQYVPQLVSIQPQYIPYWNNQQQQPLQQQQQLYQPYQVFMPVVPDARIQQSFQYQNSPQIMSEGVAVPYNPNFIAQLPPPYIDRRGSGTVWSLNNTQIVNHIGTGVGTNPFPIQTSNNTSTIIEINNTNNNNNRKGNSNSNSNYTATNKRKRKNSKTPSTLKAQKGELSFLPASSAESGLGPITTKNGIPLVTQIAAHLTITKKLKKQCPVCGKVCSRPSTPKTHYLIHSGDTPFKCPWKGCKKAFNVKSNMIRHLKTHQKKEGREMPCINDPKAVMNEPSGVTDISTVSNSKTSHDISKNSNNASESQNLQQNKKKNS